MIETLNGTHETVNYKKDTHLRLYLNAKDEYYPLHWHNDMEILCPIKENYTAICSGNTYQLLPGDILFIGPGSIHELPAQPSGLRIIFQINWTAINNIHGIDSAIARLQPCCLVTESTMPTIYEQVHQFLLEICDLYQESPILMEASIYARAMEMLTLVSREVDKKRQNVSKSTPSIVHTRESMMELCTYLADHCNEDISLDDAARFTGFSKYYFERLFKEYTNTSFYQYLINCRISRAKQLLVNNHLSVKEISYRCGFSSTAAFSKSFRQATGSSPSQFRKMYGRDVG